MHARELRAGDIYRAGGEWRRVRVARARRGWAILTYDYMTAEGEWHCQRIPPSERIHGSKRVETAAGGGRHRAEAIQAALAPVVAMLEGDWGAL